MKVPKARACEICGITDKRVLEKHHYYGRNISPKTLTLCKNCHFLITRKQNELQPGKRSRNTPKNELESFAMVSIGALISVIGDMMVTLGEYPIKER
jgi:hypothetical protein